jgi:chromosome segregation ATPase
MELQRLSSMRSALDDAAASMRNGQSEIQTATSTLSEHAALALATYDDAQKHGDTALTAAQRRMDAAADLAESVSSSLTDLQQLQGAAQTLNNSREILAGAATMLAAKGHLIDSGADAIASSAREIDGVRKSLHTTHLELHDAKRDLAQVATAVSGATTALAEQSTQVQQGLEAIGRCEAALASSTAELAAARAVLERAHGQFEDNTATLAANSAQLAGQIGQVETANQILTSMTQHLISATETLEVAQHTLTGFAANAREQALIIQSTMERMVEDQSRIGMMVTTLEHKQEQEHSAIVALTAGHQRHSRELTIALDQVQLRLVELQPVVQSLIEASSDQSRTIDAQNRKLALITSIIRWSGVGLIASIVAIVVMSALGLI